MKHITTGLFFLALITFNTGCVKDLLKKKKDPVVAPESKFYGTWKATWIAADLDNDNTLDASEINLFSGGSSELKLNSAKTFTYFLTTTSGNASLTGEWKMAADEKSITITDPANGSLRFDYRSDSELQTEPIPTTDINGSPIVAWIIYKIS